MICKVEGSPTPHLYTNLNEYFCRFCSLNIYGSRNFEQPVWICCVGKKISFTCWAKEEKGFPSQEEQKVSFCVILGGRNQETLSHPEQPVQTVSGAADENSERLSALLCSLHQTQRVQETHGENLFVTRGLFYSSLCFDDN